MDEEKPLQIRSGRKLWPWLILAVVVVAGLFAWAWYALNDDRRTSIGSYEECVAAGHPVAESYPEQCTTPDGRTFTRQLSEQEQRRMEDEVEPSSNEYTSENGVRIIVDNPASDANVSSPLNVTGQVPGSWSFEADFPIRLLDSEGRVIAETPAQLQGNWMTEELVPFTATLEFEGATGTGSLMLIKDNPSGLPENEDSVEIPVSF